MVTLERSTAQATRSARVTFYQGERERSESVSIEITDLPLVDTQREAVMRASKDPEVVAFFGEKIGPWDKKGTLLPLSGPFDEETWNQGRSYKVGA